VSTIKDVSIHPPLCRRGEQGDSHSEQSATGFQSTPRFVGEGNPVPLSPGQIEGGFNPPPALSARGTRKQDALDRHYEVSIHPPLCRRGERATTLVAGVSGEFQSTPRFVGEGNEALDVFRVGTTVSIHPPLCRRGEPAWPAAQRPGRLFQSTPRFVGEGNQEQPPVELPWMRFNPPPALSARGTRLDREAALWTSVSIHPPLCRRGERLGGSGVAS